MNKLIFLLFISFTIMISCNKKDDTIYDEQITGIQIRDVMGNDMQIEGRLNNHIVDDQFRMIWFGNPSIDYSIVIMRNEFSEPIIVSYRLVNAEYKDKPNSIELPDGSIASPIPVDNLGDTGNKKYLNGSEEISAES